MIIKNLMAQSKSSILYMRSSINFNVITNSRYYCNIPECSLDQLSSNIESLYKYMPEEFIGLSAKKVISIQNRIRTGQYSLSPFTLNVFSTIEDANPPKNSHLIHMLLNNSKCYGLVTLIPEDQLVISALGLMLNLKFVSLGIHHSFSFGYNSYPSSYFAHISSSIKEPIYRFYKIDMTRSLFVINKECLLSRLEPIILNGDIMALIRSYLYIPIILEEEEVSALKDNIPPSGLLTNVLLNLYLNEFDSLFTKQFASFSYARYLEEIIVTASQDDLLLEQSIFELFARCNLAGKIHSIVPGGEPITSKYGGIVSLSSDGVIHIDMSNVIK